MRNVVVKVGGLLVLGCLALVLYADLQSVHQIYPVEQRWIDNAADAKIRESLIKDRSRRNREEQFHKLIVGACLTIDLAAMGYLSLGLGRVLRERRARIRFSTI